MSLWIVPGAPLEGGKGWRVWFSQEGEGRFTPPTVTVSQNGVPQDVIFSWKLLPSAKGLQRRMGVLTVTLRRPAPETGGVYEFDIPQAGLSNPLRWRSLPKKIGSDGTSFFLASCFWHDDDREGIYASRLKELIKLHHPAFKLLVGDQVYGDWPNDWSTGDDGIDLYARRYAEYWGDEAYREAMLTCPTYFTCDDHEYWNDFPEKQMHLPQTWWEENRDKYGKAADQLYFNYQRCLNPDERRWYQFAIDPVSFFVTDTRSEREYYLDDGTAHFIPENQWQELESWQQQLRGPGVLVLGQPLFQKDGNWQDHSLSNFTNDYGRLWNLITQSLEGQNEEGRPHDILVLSGDIHTGRYAEAYGPVTNAPFGVPEFIASPASMIIPGSSEPELPPQKIPATYKGNSSTWKVTLDHDRCPPTLDNNVGVIKMTPGTQDSQGSRVRFELSTYRIRPYDDRSWWGKKIGSDREQGALKELFRKELELR